MGKLKCKTYKTLVLTYGSKDHASSRLRAILYFDAFIKLLNFKIFWIPERLQKNKHPVHKWIVLPISKRILKIKRFIFIVFGRFDIAYIQRSFLSEWMLRILKEKKTKIIFDFDDAIYLNFPNQKNNNANTLNMLKAADRIIVSSPVLADYCSNQNMVNIEIINTPVETERIHMPVQKNNKNIIIGWIGSPYTTFYLTEIGPALKIICNRFNAKLLVIGGSEQFTLEGVPVESHLWQFDMESEYLEKMDIGIMPLRSDDYSKGKGGYKLFQYMAAGLPIVASPVGINAGIVVNGKNGFLADSNEEWVKYLTLLIENPEERKRMGRTGRIWAEEKYSLEHCSELLVATIKPLLTI